MRYAYSQYSDLATGLLLHAHMADVCAICNSDVIHGMGKTKRLRLFRDSAADTRERLNILLYHELGIRLEDTILASRKWMFFF